MGTTVVKPDKDVDFYVLWSSTIDRPIGYGTRQEWMEYEPHNYTKDRMDRTDLNGSSCMMCSTCWGEDSTIIIYNATKKLRTVKHSDFAAFSKEFLDAFPKGWSKFTPPKDARAVLKKYGTPYDFED